MKRLKIFLINGLILTSTSFLMRMVGFSFSIYISKKVGAQALGTFQLIVSVYMFMITIATSGINLATTRMVVEQTAFNPNISSKPVMRKCFSYSLFFGCLSAILLILFRIPITTYLLHDKISSYLFLIIAVSLPFIAMASCLNGYFTALRKNGKNAVSRIFEQFIKIVSTSYLLSLLLPDGLEYALLSLILGEAISEIGSFFFTFFLYKIESKKHQNVSTLEKANWKSITSIALPVAITSYIRSRTFFFKAIINSNSFRKIWIIL